MKRREVKDIAVMKNKEQEEENEDEDSPPIQRSRTRRHGTVENVPPNFLTLKIPSPGNTLKSHSSSLVEGRRSYWDKEEEEEEEEQPVRIRSRRCGVVENIPLLLRNSHTAPSIARSQSPTPPGLSHYLRGVSPSHHILDTEGKSRPISVIITDHSVANKKSFKGSYSEIDKLGSGNEANDSDNSNESNFSNFSSPSHQGQDDNSLAAFHLSDVSDEAFGDDGERATAASSSSVILRPLRPCSPQLHSLSASQLKSSSHKSDYAFDQQQQRMDNSLSHSLLSVFSPRMGRRTTSAFSQSPKATLDVPQSSKKKMKSLKKGNNK